MSTELLPKAYTAADKEKVRMHPKLSKATARLAVAVEVLLESIERGDPEDVWVREVDADDWWAELVGRFATVSGFVKQLAAVIEFDANAEGGQVLKAMKELPDVLGYRGKRPPALLVPGTLIDPEVVAGPWRRLVFGHPAREDGSVDRNAYTLCVLEQFYRHLKRREIHADASTRWRNPQAQSLDGPAWEAVRADVLMTLGLPEIPQALLAEHTATVDAAYREVGARLGGNDAVSIEDDGKIHLSGVKVIEEPPSLLDLRKRVGTMLPRVDLPEVILEVMSWHSDIAAAFTAVSGGRIRL